VHDNVGEIPLYAKRQMVRFMLTCKFKNRVPSIIAKTLRPLHCQGPRADLRQACVYIKALARSFRQNSSRIITTPLVHLYFISRGLESSSSPKRATTKQQKTTLHIFHFVYILIVQYYVTALSSITSKNVSDIRETKTIQAKTSFPTKRKRCCTKEQGHHGALAAYITAFGDERLAARSAYKEKTKRHTIPPKREEK
jgi:hypothetical protein